MLYHNLSSKNRKKGKELGNIPFKLRGNYVSNKKDRHAKIALFWTKNCLAGSAIEDIDLINHEIELTQARNTRVKASKSLHVALTLKHGEALDEQAWRDADERLAKVLGLEEHQRVVALHKDTKNYHLHIAYNLIHPETYLKHYPEDDYDKGDQVCFAMEKKYGLVHDVRFRQAKHKDTRSVGAKDMEAHTWHQSFESYVLENKQALLTGVDKAQSWQDVHQLFAQHELKLKLRGNGLVISQGKHQMQASRVDRSLSKHALEKRFGKFKAMRRHKGKNVSSCEKYSLRPRFPLKGVGQRQLWSNFLKKKKQKPTISWKEYLLLMEGFDPLAMTIIKLNTSMMNSLSPRRRQHSRSTPSSRHSPYINHGLLEAHDMGAFEETAITLGDITPHNKPNTKGTELG